MSDLSGKIVMVTGASSGIGSATAIQAAENQADLILHYCGNEPGVLETAAEVRNRGRECCVIQADFSANEPTFSAVMRKFSDEAWGWRNRLDVIVNNAGGDVLTNDRKQWSFFEKLEFLWHVDVKSCLYLSRVLGSQMAAQSKSNHDSKTSLPSIINVGWDQAQTGQAGDSGEMFATTKGAIISFTRSLAKSLAPHVRVNCVAPGWIQTSWGESTSEYWDQRAKQESLLKRWGTPEDVAKMICSLASDRSGFINGQVIEVNGGLGFGVE